MIGLLYVNIDTPNGASRIIVDGELQLVQSAPIRIDSVRRTLYNVNPFDDYDQLSLQEMLELYHNRKGNPLPITYSFRFYRTHCIRLHIYCAAVRV